MNNTTRTAVLTLAVISLMSLVVLPNPITNRFMPSAQAAGFTSTRAVSTDWLNPHNWSPNAAALGQNSTVAEKRLVTVQIKNGPLVQGRLILSDKHSIELEIEKASCGITLEMSEVASIIYADQDLAGNTAQVSLASSDAPKASRQAVTYRHKSRRSYR